MAIYRGKGGKTDVVPADGDQEFAGSIIAEKDIHAHGNISADGDIKINGAIHGDASGLENVPTPFLQADDCIYLNNQVITNDYTMPINKNGMSAGDITVNGEVTIPEGSEWHVIGDDDGIVTLETLGIPNHDLVTVDDTGHLKAFGIESESPYVGDGSLLTGIATNTDVANLTEQVETNTRDIETNSVAIQENKDAIQANTDAINSIPDVIDAYTKEEIDAQQVAQDAEIATKLGEAPKDGEQYVRKDGVWAELAAADGGITDAPADGKTYGRKNYDWEEVVGDGYTIAETDALLDGKADKGDSYTKVEADAALNAKADKSDTYTKAETYRKAEVDAFNAAQDTKINKNVDDIRTNKTNITANADAISAVSSRVTANENDIIELEQEIEALAPSFDRGTWKHDPIEGMAARAPIEGAYYLASATTQITREFNDTHQIYFHNTDSSTPPQTHTFSDVQEGMYVELFEALDSSYFLGIVTSVSEGTTHTVVDVTMVKAEGGPTDESGGVRVKFFTMEGTVNLDGYMPKSGGTFTGSVNYNGAMSDDNHLVTKKYVDDATKVQDDEPWKPHDYLYVNNCVESPEEGKHWETFVPPKPGEVFFFGPGGMPVPDNSYELIESIYISKYDKEGKELPFEYENIYNEAGELININFDVYGKVLKFASPNGSATFPMYNLITSDIAPEHVGYEGETFYIISIDIHEEGYTHKGTIDEGEIAQVTSPEEGQVLAVWEAKEYIHPEDSLYKISSANTETNQIVVNKLAIGSSYSKGERSLTNIMIGNEPDPTIPSWAGGTLPGLHWNTITSDRNIAIGQDSLKSATDVVMNTAVGFQSLATLKEGWNNTAIGYGAGFNLVKGNSNVFIGQGAGPIGGLEEVSGQVVLGDSSAEELWVGNNKIFPFPDDLGGGGSGGAGDGEPVAFRAHLGYNQPQTGSAPFTQVELSDVDFDTHDYFVAGAFQPEIEGYYQVNGVVTQSANPMSTNTVAALYKNGVQHTLGAETTSTGQASIRAQVNDIVYLNGDGDNIALYGSTTSTTRGFGMNGCWLSAVRIGSGSGGNSIVTQDGTEVTVGDDDVTRTRLKGHITCKDSTRDYSDIDVLKDSNYVVTRAWNDTVDKTELIASKSLDVTVTEGDLRFITGGNYSMTIDNSGDVTTNRNINWGRYGNGRLFSDGNWGCILRSDNKSPTVADFMFQNANDVERMRIDTTGAVKITGSLYVNGVPKSVDSALADLEKDVKLKDKLIEKLSARLDKLEKRMK